MILRITYLSILLLLGSIIQLNAQFYGGVGDGISGTSTGILILNLQDFYCSGGNGDGYNSFSNPSELNTQSFYCNGGLGQGYSSYSSGNLTQNNQTFYCNGGTYDGQSYLGFSGTISEQGLYCGGGIADGSTFLTTGNILVNDQNLYCSGGIGDGLDTDFKKQTLNIQSLYCYGGQNDGNSKETTSGFLYGTPLCFNGGTNDGFTNQSYSGLLYGTPVFCFGGEGDGHHIETSQITSIGIGIWTGITSSDWSTGSNWTHNTVPNLYIDATIPAGCPNYPTITQYLGVNLKKTALSCQSLVINPNAAFTTTSNIYVHGVMQVDGDFISNVNVEAGLRVREDGVLSLSSSGSIIVGNQSSGVGINDLIVYSDGVFVMDGGTLEIDDQFVVLSGGTFQMTDGELSAHKYGEGTPYSSGFPGGFVIQSGAFGSVSGGTIKICGRESVGDYHAFNILEPSFQFSGTSYIQFEHGLYATHYNPSISIVDGVTIQNLTINKPGNTVFIKSNLVVKEEFKIKSGSTVELESGQQITVGQQD